MARTANVFARVESERKEQAERVPDRLGIPMSNAEFVGDKGKEG